MDTQSRITPTELRAIGYTIEEFIEEYWSNPVLNESYFFRVIAPDGQHIAENCTDPLEAWDQARLHYEQEHPQP